MVVVGAGRIGLALRARAERAGAEVVLVDRDANWDVVDRPAGTPIVLAVRPESLDDVIARVPARRRSDLVFLQNGALRELLRDHGLDEVTRGVLYVMTARRGDDLVPGDVSVFSGPHAGQVVDWFGRLAVPAEVVQGARFAEIELEKLVWLAVMGPLCEVHGVPVGPLVQAHRAEVAALAEELSAVCARAWGVRVDGPKLVERLVGYSNAIPTYHASVKEWPWRNGWLFARARELGVPTPLHDRLLAETGHLR
ncbi:MAG: ketopantoate reductase C-terminal domain-containing protein [Myxococcota bacterium]